MESPNGPIGNLPLTLQEAMGRYFEENASLGEGDLRASITLEALQRTETADHWVIYRKKRSRADVMELLLNLVASGFSIPAILQEPGMPHPRTYMGWLNDYKPFAELMEQAEKMRAIILAEQSLQIMDGCEDPKMVFRDKTKAELRMRMAEVLHGKKFGKKQNVDVTHNFMDLSSPEVWSRFESVLISHAALIEANTRVKIIVPKIEEAEIVKEEVETSVPDQASIGMQGNNQWDFLEEE